MITRAHVQGFIDGLKAAGDDMKDLEKKVEKWLREHHTYPMHPDEAKRVSTDVGSYKK